MENSSPRQLYKVTTSGFILDDQSRILILKRGDQDDFLPGFWQAPGGAVETGESIEQCLARKIREQTGLVATCDRLFGYFIYPDAKHQMSLNLNFICSLRDPHEPVTPSGGMTECTWSDLLGLANYKMTPEMYEACRLTVGGGQ